MTSNPLYVTPAVMVLYRADQAFSLHNLIPRKGRYEGNYDMVIAAQPYRSRMSADFKVSKILSPLARSLDIGTSTLLAAWNAAVYVAQIDDDRLTEKLRTGEYIEATKRVLQWHGGLWFQDESFVVVRIAKGS